jgi:hypothetical protein
MSANESYLLDLPPKKSSGKRARIFNIATSKFHFLGDYVSHIRLFGTTDSYSTQLVRRISFLLTLLTQLASGLFRENWLIA